MTFRAVFELEQSSRVLAELEITSFQKFALTKGLVATPAVYPRFANYMTREKPRVCAARIHIAF